MRHEYRNAQGQRCCATDDARTLCAVCRRAHAAHVRASMTDVDLRALLDAALKRVEQSSYLGIRAVDEFSTVIYDAVDEAGAVRTFARGFVFDDDGGVVLDAEREAVIAQTQYVAAIQKADPYRNPPDPYARVNPRGFQYAANESPYGNPPDPYAKSRPPADAA